MTIHEAATSGVRLRTLETLRDKLAQEIDDCDSTRDLAALSRQLTLVLAEIDELAEPEKKGDAVDEIAQRRAARRSSPAKGSARSARPS